MKQLLKFASELGPVAAFFITYKMSDFYHATIALMIATPLALFVSWMVFRKIAMMPLVMGAIVMGAGALTIYYNDPIFVKMKPTVVNFIFSAILFIGLYYGKLIPKIVLGEAMQLKEEGWKIITVRMAFFFLFLAILNEVVWRGSEFIYMPVGDVSAEVMKAAMETAENLWVDFKFYVLMPSTFIFLMFQLGVIQKYMIEPENNSKTEAET